MAVRFDVKFVTAAERAADSPVFAIAAIDMLVERLFTLVTCGLLLCHGKNAEVRQLKTIQERGKERQSTMGHVFDELRMSGLETAFASYQVNDTSKTGNAELETHLMMWHKYHAAIIGL